MKTFAFTLILMMFAWTINAQETKDPQNMKVVTDQEAHYPAGDEALSKLIQKKVIYSETAINKELDGSVMISFDVLADSTLSGIKIISGIGYGIDQQIMEILKGIKFAPAVMMGVIIKRNVLITIPIRTSKTMIEKKPTQN